jgi:myo-inositol 2-dehydrogenase/D-chiro-inositol 1-dehydrogenase
LPDVELVAIADSQSARRKEAVKRAPRAVAFDNYQELLKVPEVEAVVVCLPPALHAEAAIASFQAGKHLYLEKPIATNLSDARAVLQAWRQAGTVGMAGFNYRFNLLYHSAKQVIQSGGLGDLVAVRTVFSSRADEVPGWKQMRKDGGGALLDLASHHIDLILFLFEEDIAEVSAKLRSQHGEGDSVILQMRLANDLLVQSFFSISAVDEDRFEVYGQNGKITFDRYAGDLTITAPAFEYGRLKLLRRQLMGLKSAVKCVIRPPGEPSFRLALGTFASASMAGRTVAPSLEDGYRSLAVIEAAEESAKHGMWSRPLICE